MRWNIGYFGVKDLFTLINMLGGMFGVYFAFKGNIPYASLSIFAGYVCGDTVDGTVARLTNTANKFGGEFDAVTDHFSQTIAPAIIAFSAYRLGGHETLGLLVMTVLITTATIRHARFFVEPFNYRLTWCGLPRTISGIVAAALPNSTLFFKEAIYGYEGASAILILVAILNLCPIPYMTHRGRKIQNYVRVLIAAFFIVPAVLIVVAPNYIFDFVFVWSFGYALTGWMPLSFTERREFWTEYKRWSKVLVK